MRVFSVALLTIGLACNVLGKEYEFTDAVYCKSNQACGDAVSEFAKAQGLNSKVIETRNNLGDGQGRQERETVLVNKLSDAAREELLKAHGEQIEQVVPYLDDYVVYFMSNRERDDFLGVEKGSGNPVFDLNRVVASSYVASKEIARLVEDVDLTHMKKGRAYRILDDQGPSMCDYADMKLTVEQVEVMHDLLYRVPGSRYRSAPPPQKMITDILPKDSPLNTNLYGGQYPLDIVERKPYVVYFDSPEKRHYASTEEAKSNTYSELLMAGKLVKQISFGDSERYGVRSTRAGELEWFMEISLTESQADGMRYMVASEELKPKGKVVSRVELLQDDKESNAPIEAQGRTLLLCPSEEDCVEAYKRLKDSFDADQPIEIGGGSPLPDGGAPLPDSENIKRFWLAGNPRDKDAFAQQLKDITDLVPYQMPSPSKFDLIFESKDAVTKFPDALNDAKEKFPHLMYWLADLNLGNPDAKKFSNPRNWFASPTKEFTVELDGRQCDALYILMRKDPNKLGLESIKDGEGMYIKTGAD